MPSQDHEVAGGAEAFVLGDERNRYGPKHKEADVVDLSVERLPQR